MGAAFKTEFEFYDYCFQFSEEASLRILKESIGEDKLETTPLKPGEDFSYDHWVCSIAVALGEAKVYVKAHFDSKTARKVAAKGTQLTEKGLPTSVLIDFMREYLNQIMGDIKSQFLSEEEDVSVPEISPSYDEGIGSENNLDVNSRFWKIELEFGQIILGCYITAIGDVTSIEKKSEEDGDESNIEFL